MSKEQLSDKIPEQLFDGAWYSWAGQHWHRWQDPEGELADTLDAARELRKVLKRSTKHGPGSYIEHVLDKTSWLDK